ncbi:hypothetical protein BS333_20850 (plasmid) [Vibrio azureus]|uniref:Uncharacterized protein n=1 Tax=Vibrio azureus NBRC 104587 TaxID=1219077 RepID=U3C1A6_9VIBR|nr:hypothetical protein BS333_20850 [Vibrio azureus]GAD75284.1 hypothetical protein VAZ01S_023_00510 [Vibrio azureus NBRC 104587]
MVGKSAMELVLGFVGKTHALNMYGLFSLTSFGAFFVFHAPSAYFWTKISFKKSKAKGSWISFNMENPYRFALTFKISS